MNCLAYTASPAPSNIVHAIVTTSMGYQLLCDVRWSIADDVYNARVLTVVDPIGRSMTVMLTRDPIDCMSCLVARTRS